MSLLISNVVWGIIDACLLLALARGVRPVLAFTLALAAAMCAWIMTFASSPHMFQSIAALASAVFLHVPFVLLANAWLFRRVARRAAASALVAVAVLLVGADAFLYEPHALVTTPYEIPADRSLRMVVISDFQAAEIGDYERGVLARIASLDPEIVLLAGDYIQVYGRERAAVVRDFRKGWQEAGIHPRLGTFAVRGDVEPDNWENELFAGLGVVTSNRTRSVMVGDIAITLLSLWDSAKPDLVVSAHSGAAMNLVLGHRPDYALGHGSPGLLVAGHTHGGQVQIPFWGPPVTLSGVPRAWAAGGLFSIEGQRQLLVTRGTGLEHGDHAPALRFNCRPEVVALTLKRGSPAGASSIAR